jgi:hypothetical protein
MTSTTPSLIIWARYLVLNNSPFWPISLSIQDVSQIGNNNAPPTRLIPEDHHLESLLPRLPVLMLNQWQADHWKRHPRRYTRLGYRLHLASCKRLKSCRLMLLHLTFRGIYKIGEFQSNIRLNHMDPTVIRVTTMVDSRVARPIRHPMVPV